MAKLRFTKEEYKKYIKYSANRSRNLADEMASMLGGCDDPMHPYGLFDENGNQRFISWVDFVEQVCIPLVEADGEEVAVQKAMKLYRTESPYYICVSLYFALNRIRELEKILEKIAEREGENR